jgi:hypothetical protein
MKLMIESKEAKRLVGLELHQDGIEPPNSLEQRSVVAFVR